MSDSTDSCSIVRFISKERPTDRFIGVVNEKIKSPHGELTAISLTEIADRWNPAIEAGEAIWQTFVRQFTSSKAKSILTKFEDALKSINQLLEGSEEKISQPINCVIAILNGVDLYFSTIHTGEISLWRSNKLTKITTPAGKRFTTVTSGELQKNDGLLFASKELRAVIQKINAEELGKKPKAELLEKLVSSQRPEIRRELAGLLIEIGTRPESKTIYTDETTKSLQLKSRILPAIATLKEKWQSLAATLSNRFHNGRDQRSKEVLNSPDEEETLVSDEITKDIVPAKQGWLKSWRKLILPIAFTTLLIIGIVIVYGQLKKLTAKEPKVSTPTIASLITKTPENELFTFISQNLTIDNYKNLSDKDRDSFNQTITRGGRELVTHEAKVTDLPEPVIALDTTATNLYAIDKTGQLWRYKDSLAKVSQKALVTNPVSLTALADNKIVVSDQAGAIWLFNGSADQPINLALPQQLAQGVKLLQKFGSSNLYIYQATSQTVYKVGGFISDIPPEPAIWVEPAVLNFGALADWAIPGDFLGVADDGKIRSFNRTKLAGLSVDYYQDNVLIRLSLGQENNQMVVGRGKFVTTYSTNDGSKVKEKILVTTDLINDLSLGPNKTLWAAAGKSLYKLP